MKLFFCTKRRKVDDTVYFGATHLANWLFAAVKEASINENTCESVLIRKALCMYLSIYHNVNVTGDAVEELDRRLPKGENE